MIKKRKSRLLGYCKICNRPFTEVIRFTHKSNRYYDGLKKYNRCVECSNRLSSSYKKTDVGIKIGTRANIAVRKRILHIKKDFIINKGGKCSMCGYSDLSCIDVFDFHHLNPEHKIFSFNSATIRKYMYKNRWNMLNEESTKCIILCANCHRKTHAGYQIE